jgi:hypothetical protein
MILKVEYGMKKTLVAVVFLLLIALTFYAVSKSSELSQQKLATKQTETVSQNVPDFAVYPNSSVVESSSEDQESFSAELNLNETVKEVSSWYIDTLQKENWEIDSSSFDPNNEEVQNIRATKGELSIIVSVIKNPDYNTKIVLAQWKRVEDEDEEVYLE